MSKIYLKTLICIVAVLWLYYFIFIFSYTHNNEVKEQFIPMINSYYNPCKRKFNKIYEGFIETPNLIMNKFYKQAKKWNIIY
jgi:hypothetical protein